VENRSISNGNSSFEANESIDSVQERCGKDKLTEAKKKEIDMKLGKFSIRSFHTECQNNSWTTF
jgi:hypothetical protein